MQDQKKQDLQEVETKTPGEFAGDALIKGEQPNQPPAEQTNQGSIDNAPATDEGAE